MSDPIKPRGAIRSEADLLREEREIRRRRFDFSVSNEQIEESAGSDLEEEGKDAE